MFGPAPRLVLALAIVVAFVAVAGGCSGFTRSDQLPAARLIAPLSTATVENDRPTLRFALPSGGTRPLVQLCEHRSCSSTRSATVDVAGSSAVPDQPLAPGVWYWRVRAQTPKGQSTSAVWQFTVPAMTSSGDGSWGSALDLDGDGYADLAVGAPWASLDPSSPGADGRVYIYRGGPNGPDPSQVTVLDPPGLEGAFGHSLAAVDFDGDGFADLAVGSPTLGTAGSGDTGLVYLFRGGPHGVSPAPALQLDYPGADGLGWSLAFAGDPNGDGYGDLIAGAPTSQVNGVITGEAVVFFGGTESRITVALQPSAGPLAQVGSAVAGGGDLDGDGVDDVVVGAPGVPGGANYGQAYVFLGLSLGFDTDWLTIDASPPALARFGAAVALLHDFAGDGVTPVAISAPGVGPGRIYVVPVQTAANTGTLDGPDGANGQFGAALAAGDTNGDGRGDLLIGAVCAPGPVCGAGRAYLYVAGEKTLTTIPALADDQTFGAAVSLGDCDGDGRGDPAIGAADTGNSLGRAEWFHLDALDAPAVTLSGVDPGARYGLSLR
jgi:FG-GAP repeat